MDIDVNLVIEKLLAELGELKLNNVMLELQVEKLMEEAHIEEHKGED